MSSPAWLVPDGRGHRPNSATYAGQSRGGGADRLKLTENTLVISSSDNGPARASRPTELELQYDTATGAGWGSAAFKGTTAGRKGYKAALFEGGISQVAVLKGSATSGRSKPLFWKMDGVWPPQKGAPFHWVTYAVVDQQWKLLVNRDASHVELYDIASDALETKELSAGMPVLSFFRDGLFNRLAPFGRSNTETLVKGTVERPGSIESRCFRYLIKVESPFSYQIAGFSESHIQQIIDGGATHFGLKKCVQLTA